MPYPKYSWCRVAVALCALFFTMVSTTAEAAYVIQGGRIMQERVVATMSAREHYRAAVDAYEREHWEAAAKNFNIIAVNFPSSAFAQEAYYFLGVSYFYMEEYDHANAALSEYLKVQNNPRYFQSAIEFKFAIAEKFKAGARRRPFGSKQLPKWVPGQSASLSIYNEVIATVPCHEIAAQALIAKGCLLWKWRDYQDAVEAFQMVIRRFPKYEETPMCYLYIGKVYLEQSAFEFQNSDILALAQVNLRRFENDFPREPLLQEAENDVMAVKEVYAAGLYETGRFYERKCQPRAAVIYYNDAIRQFPETCAAQLCWKRIGRLNPAYCVNLPEVETLDEEEIAEIADETEGTVDSVGINIENANVDFQ